MRRARQVSTLLAASSCILAAAACGSSSGSSAEAHKPAAQVLADAKSALFNAKAVHVSGTMTSQGQTASLDFQFQGQDSQGSVTSGGVTEQIIKTGTSIYVKAPAAFWTKVAGAQAASLANKWISLPAAQAATAANLTLQGIAAAINTSDSPLNPTTTTTKINGTKAIVLTQKSGSTLDVADSTTPDPLKITNTGTEKDSITFTGYGKTQTIKAPAGALTPQQAAKSAPSTS